MTRAKSKPSIPTREPSRARRAAASVEKPSLATPGVVGAKVAAPLEAKASRSAAKAVAPKARAEKAEPTRTVAASKPATASPAKAARAAAASSPAPVTKAVSGKKTLPRPALPKAPRLQPLDTPAKIRPIEQAVGVSSDAVLRRTGKSWAEWFALLDAAGAADFDHKGIVAVLAQRHGVGPWWQQMVTVAYEQARGKTGKQANEDGFQVDLVKTLELPLAKLYRLWSEPSERNKWLADDRFSIHKATAPKSIRARWGRGVSRIDVDFCEKGPTKSQVTVQHNRIESSDAAEQMKAYWAKKIGALEALLNNA